MNDKADDKDNRAPSFRSRRRHSHVRRVAQGVTVTLRPGFPGVEISPRATIRSRRISDAWGKGVKRGGEEEEREEEEEGEEEGKGGNGAGEDVGCESGRWCGVWRCVRRAWAWRRAE